MENTSWVRKVIVGIVALAIAAVAAYFSVIGISKLFGGSPIATKIMGTVLEAGKLVCASVAYSFFMSKRRVLASVFSFFTVIMMLVTSIGIYGFLSSSYKQVASSLSVNEQKIEAVEEKKALYENRLDRYDQERKALLEDKRSLRGQLQTASQKYAERGWKTDKEAVERLQDQVAKTQNQLDRINSKISVATDSVSAFNQRKLDLKTGENVDVRSKLGPVIQTAGLFGIERDNAVLIFIGMIMFVFDPMAVALVVAFNVMTGRHSENREERVSETSAPVENKEKPDVEEVVVSPSPSKREVSSGGHLKALEGFQKQKDSSPTQHTSSKEDPEESEDKASKEEMEEFSEEVQEQVEEIADEDGNEITKEDIDTLKDQIKKKGRKYKVGKDGGMSVESNEN
jgi:hypothetical protein